MWVGVTVSALGAGDPVVPLPNLSSMVVTLDQFVGTLAAVTQAIIIPEGTAISAP